MQIKEIHINEEKKQVTMWAQSEIRMREELKEDGMEVDDLGNEYMYLLSFDEAGEKLTKVVEFMDSLRVQQLKVVFFKALENLAKIEEKADRSQ